MSLLLLTVVVGEEEHLQDAQRASSKVQHDIANTPALSAPTDTVHPGLRESTGGRCYTCISLTDTHTSTHARTHTHTHTHTQAHTHT